MLPISIRCKTCGNFISKGIDFNSRQEELVGKTYLEIPKFRVYFKCTNSSAESTIKTDHQNSDYIVESGATRNFEPWRAEDEGAERQRRKREFEEMGDALKYLENKTLDFKREMDSLAALDELKSLKSRQSAVGFDAMLEALHRNSVEKEKELREEEDELLIKSIFQRPKEIIPRIPDEVFNDDANPIHLSSGNGNLKRRKVSEEVILDGCSL